MKTKELGIGLGIGLAIGCLVALLVAPASGKETRQKIATKAREIKDKIIKPSVDSIHRK